MGDVVFGKDASGQDAVTVNVELVKGRILAGVRGVTAPFRRCGECTQDRHLQDRSGTTTTTGMMATHDGVGALSLVADGDGRVTTRAVTSIQAKVSLDGHEVAEREKLTRTWRGDYISGSEDKTPTEERSLDERRRRQEADGAKNGNDPVNEKRNSPQDDQAAQEGGG